MYSPNFYWPIILLLLVSMLANIFIGGTFATVVNVVVFIVVVIMLTLSLRKNKQEK